MLKFNIVAEEQGSETMQTLDVRTRVDNGGTLRLEVRERHSDDWTLIIALKENKSALVYPRNLKALGIARNGTGFSQ